MNPKISVIVPVYKAEKYLHKCVDSILAQTFTDFEVLLVDDGSPDRSGEICDEYAARDSRVKVFHKENGGVSSARQCGMDHAEGEYTIHADPDDWVEPTMLEELYRKAKEEDADMVMCDYYANYSQKQVYIRQKPSALDHETVLKEMFYHLHGSCCNKLIRRSVWMKYHIEFPKDLNYCEDLYVNTWLLKHDIKISYTGKAFYHYEQTINADSLVRHVSENIIDSLRVKLKCILPYSFYKQTIKPAFSYRKAIRLFKNKNISQKMYRAYVLNQRLDIFQMVRKNFGKVVFLFISCFGIKYLYNKNSSN